MPKIRYNRVGFYKTKQMSTAQKDAFIQGIESGKFNTDRARVYQLLTIESQTLEQLKVKLNKKGLNELSGRVTDLLDMGLIRETSRNRYTKYEVVTDELKQSMLANQRQYEKALRWKKQGEERGYTEILNLKTQTL